MVYPLVDGHPSKYLTGPDVEQLSRPTRYR